MKIIHQVNKWSFVITLLLYLTLVLGLVAQVGLGVLQVILAILLTVQLDKLSKAMRFKLLLYWVFMLSYLVFFYTIRSVHMGNDFFEISFFCIIPMLIAAYFVYITHTLQKESTLKKAQHEN